RDARGTVYLNGKQAGTMDVSRIAGIDLGRSLTTEQAALGDAVGSETPAWNYRQNHHYDGVMDEFMIFRKALSSADIEKMYRRTGGR
ncbi:MAG: hypothetical protein AAF492_08050, partial [Verrucomicrobiota bacterium]